MHTAGSHIGGEGRWNEDGVPQLRRTLGILGLATFVVAFSILIQHRFRGYPISWGRALQWALPVSLFWSLLRPGIARLVRRWNPDGLGWVRVGVMHLPVALGFSLAYVALRAGVDLMMPWLAPGHLSARDLLGLHLRYSFSTALLVYAATVAACYALEYRRRYRSEQARYQALDRRISALAAAPVAEDAAQASPVYRARFIVRMPSRTYSVPAEQVEWIEAERNYIALRIGGDTHLVRETMKSVEAELDPAVFTRVHRSAIVNVDHVRELRLRAGGEWVAVLRSGSEVRTSPRGRVRLQERMAAR